MTKKQLTAIAALGMSLTVHAVVKPEKPNVLYIVSDDLNTALSGFGHAQCKTPNLDRLAQRGVKFESMHCQYPVCGASRASIMSGLYPYSSRCLGNTFNFREQTGPAVTMSQAFMNQGYYAGRVSKIYHMGIPGEILDGTALYDDGYSWNEAFNIQALEQYAPGVSTNWSPLNTRSQTFTGVIASTGDSEHADGMAADRAIEILGRVKNDPFFLAVGFVRPHVPLVAPEAYFDLYNREDMIAPFVPEGDLDDVPEIIRDYKSNSTTYGVTPELHKGLLEAYYASISYMDAQVGRVLDALEDQGLADNTIVVFTSDHGYLLGEHDKFQKQHLFEECTRVPFIISVPWMEEQHGKATQHLTELIDLYPTLTDLAGVPAPETLQGTSLKTLLEDPQSSAWKKDVVFTISRDGGESIRTKDWRFTQWGFGESGMELYDLNEDPNEFTNLAADPEYADEVAALQAQLLAKRDAAGYQYYLDLTTRANFSIALEEWNFNNAQDGNGLDLPPTLSSVNWLPLGASPLGYTSNRLAHFEATGALNEEFYSTSAGTSFSGIDNEVVQISWDVVTADFSNTAAADDTYYVTGGFGFVDRQSGERINMAALKYQDSTFSINILHGLPGLESVIASGTSSISGLNIRMICDFSMAGDAGSLRVFTTLNGAAEMEHHPGALALHAGVRFDEFLTQFKATKDGRNWQPGDYMDVDNIQVLGSPGIFYNDWLKEQGFTSETKLKEDANGDGVNNLTDYAIGGTTNLPVVKTDHQYLCYIHTEREPAQAAARGLSYVVQQTADLQAPEWSVNNVEFAGSTAGPDTGFRTVTNQVFMSDTNGFMRLDIQFTP